MFFKEWENNQSFSKSPSSAPSELALSLSVRTSQTNSTQQRPQTMAGPSCLETDSHSDGQQISHLWKPRFMTMFTTSSTGPYPQPHKSSTRSHTPIL